MERSSHALLEPSSDSNNARPIAGSIALESKGLEPQYMPGMAIGYCSDINGPDAVLVDFMPTKAELKTLAYHYLERCFVIERHYAIGYSGSREIREHAFAWRPFDAIAGALSPEPVKEFEEYIERESAEVDKIRQVEEQRQTDIEAGLIEDC